MCSSLAGALAMNLGRLDEAIALYRQAVAQDPLRAAGYHNLGMALDASDRLAEAEAAYRKALELAPQRAGPRAYLALNLLAQGRGDEALAEALREPDEGFRLWALAIIEHAAGRRAESDTALQELIAKYQDAAAYQVAQVYGARGEADLAFDWLERAYVATRSRALGDEVRSSFALAARRSAVGRLPAQDGSRGLRRKLVAARRGACDLLHDRSAMSAISDSHVRPLLAESRR